MSSNLTQIQNNMLSIYNNNMNFLKKYDVDLFKRIEIFSKKIEDNNISERYVIDIEKNMFNIIDVSLQDKLYKAEPYYDSEYKISRYFPNMQDGISLIRMKKIDEIREPRYTIDCFKYINKYFDLYKNKNKNKIQNKIFKYIGKYAFVGTLLGIHIEKLHKKIQAKKYLILEDSLEIFRLSLFFCNYKKISKKSKITFAIELDDLDLRRSIKFFLKEDFSYNHIIKYTLASNKYKKSLEKLTEQFALENPLLYPFSDYLGAYKSGIKYIQDGYKVLNFTKIKGLFENKPVLYLGPGPSLSKNIEFIKKAEKYFILICLASTLRLLSDNKIVPDIIISIDASTLIVKQFEVPKKYYENSIVLTSTRTDWAIIKKLNKKNLFMIQDSIEFFKNFGILRGNSSGEIGYSLCCYFNIKELYFLGLDVALNQKTKSTHDASYYINKEMNQSDYEFSEFGELDFNKDIIKVQGNFQKEVYTTRRYQQLIYNYNEVTRSNTSNINVYNLSDGAYLEGIPPLKIEKIDFDTLKKIRKKKLHTNIIEYFDEKSKINHNKNEKTEIKMDKKLANELLTVLVDDNKRFNEIFYNFKRANPVSFIIQILDFYFYVITPYTSFLDNGEKNMKKKIENTEVKQIKQILKFYLKI